MIAGATNFVLLYRLSKGDPDRLLDSEDPTPTKVAMIVLLWVGRIEIVPVLVLFTPAFRGRRARPGLGRKPDDGMSESGGLIPAHSVGWRVFDRR